MLIHIEQSSEESFHLYTINAGGNRYELIALTETVGKPYTHEIPAGRQYPFPVVMVTNAQCGENNISVQVTLSVPLAGISKTEEWELEKSKEGLILSGLNVESGQEIKMDCSRT